MHEAGLMTTVLEVAVERARGVGALRIHRLRLRVGVLSGVVPEALRCAFLAMAPGGPADGAELEIEVVPAVCRCGGCGREFEARNPVPDCPWCGGWGERLRSGLELELASLEVS